ncbi:hypothetical protein QAD02_016272 [Eretmocerus hayati]|uniref:Uncharacterized protein n=1 Tax=Eretmocerus hayati TaxID=131215 RepID=A0ACC2PA54_9HYME|nr:hypothetical protein QAD02_016272 [Eretmocerus hayati]
MKSNKGVCNKEKGLNARHIERYRKQQLIRWPTKRRRCAAGLSDEDCCKGGNSREDCMAYRSCGRGTLLVPGEHRIKSDCNPNAISIFKDYDGRLIYFALRPINKGDMITSAEYGSFYKHAKDIRQEYMDTVDFTCACKACIEGWPTLSGSKSNYMVSLL